jgi:phosphinothricin acetyltransferase
MIRLRVGTPGDGAACAEIYRPIVENTWISFETEAPSAAEMALRIERTLPRFPWLVATQDDRVVGYAYAGSHRERAAYRWSADVTVYLAEQVRGKGVGRRIYGGLFDILRRQGLRSAFAGVALPNDPSVALHQAMGFEPVGVYREVGHKLGGWRSVGWWRLALSTQSGDPAEPLPFDQLRLSASFGSPD